MKSKIPECVQQAGLVASEIYLQSIEKGTSPRMAEMFALRQAPGSDTDDQFLNAMGTLRQQFDNDDNALKRHCEAAQKHGYTPRANDVYLPSLARFAGDPRAHVRSKGEAIKYATDTGRAAYYMGREVAKSRQPESDWLERCNPMADDLVAESLPRLHAEDSTLRKRSKAEQRDAAIQRHGGTMTRKLLKK